MVPVSSIIACCITLFISLILPVLVLLVYGFKHRKQGIFSAWLLGAAGFVVTQLLIRVPILNVLSVQPWFLAFSQNHLFLYAFSLAFTAGLFELAGRFAVAKLMQKRLTYRRSLSAGLGHGGIEAMVLVGITYINNLAYIVTSTSGGFGALFAPSAAMGVTPAPLELIRTQLLATSPVLFLLGGFERLLAMTGHVAMSMLVCYGVAHKKVLPCTLLCLGIHTLMDLNAGVSLVLPQSLAYPIIYASLIVMTVLSLLIIRRLGRCWKKEVSYDPEK